MNSIFIIAFASFALIACSNGGGSSGQGGVSPSEQNQTQSKPVDITDRLVCQGQTPNGMSLFSNDWTARHLVKNGVILDRTMHFSSSSVEVVIKATYENDSRQIRVRLGISTESGAFEVLNSGSDQTTLPTGDDSFKLSIELKPMKFSYSFIGPCLMINAGSDTLVLTPKEN